MNTLIILVLLIASLIFFIIRINVAYINQNIIMDAIHSFNINAICNGNYTDHIPYKKMESLEKTLFRFWDFGYKNIVDPETYELIKSFIKTK